MSRIIKAFFYSLDGIKATYKNEPAFRQEVWVSLILLPLPLFMPLDGLFKVYLISCMLLVFLMEIANSAIEAVVDMVTEDFHELAKRAKDMGSALVLVACLNLVLAWGFAVAECFWG
jgi:diacylglycerol kinase (ATP)